MTLHASADHGKPVPGLPTLLLSNAQIDIKKRVISGTATVYGQEANAHGGRTIFLHGSLHTPADLRNAKLLIEHDVERSVGYCIASEDEGDCLKMAFHLPPGDEADTALAKAADGTRDGLSVGLEFHPNGYTYSHETQVITVTNATIREVSLCAVPAFDAARVETVQASTKGPTMDEKANVTPTPTPQIDASAPGTFHPAPPVNNPRPRLDSITAAAELVHGMIQSGSSASQINAALQDVLIADVKDPAAFETSFIGKIWQARRTDRLWIDSITKRELEAQGLKSVGWKWTARPTVAAYPGNKEEIHSNKVSTEPVEVSIERTAGGWDVDRIFFDRGNPEFISEMWAAALEDFLVKTDAKVRTAIVTAATALDPVTTPTAALTQLGGKAVEIGAKISAVGFAADMWMELAEMTMLDIPWWMRGGDTLNIGTSTGSVGGLRLFADPALTAGTIIGLDSRAVTYKEPSAPIRVQALDIPRGGIDMAMFGYHSTLVNDARAIFKASVS